MKKIFIISNIGLEIEIEDLDYNMLFFGIAVLNLRLTTATGNHFVRTG